MQALSKLRVAAQPLTSLDVARKADLTAQSVGALPLGATLDDIPDGNNRRLGAVTLGTRAVQSLGSSGTLAIDLSFPSGSNIWQCAPSANITFSLTNATVAAGTCKEWEIWIVMGATARSVTWFAGITWQDGSVPAIATGKTSHLTFRKEADGKIYGNLAYS